MVTRPWIVHVAPLLRAAGTRRHEEMRAPVTALEVSASGVPADADVEAALTLESLSGPAILATGTVDAPWAGECVRCLGPASGKVRVTVRELYEPGSDSEETYPLVGDQVDLEPLVRDAVLLHLPLAPLCADDCLGLCPVCGANLNLTSCSCAAEIRDPRWSALDQLRPAEGGKQLRAAEGGIASKD